MTARADGAVSACSSSRRLLTASAVYKSSCPAGCQWGKSAFGQMSATLSPELPASEIKQTFLSPNPACLLAFVQRAAGPCTLF